MLSLQDLLGAAQGEEAVGQISNQVGADSSMVNTAIQYALPAILGGLANNASTPDGAQSLDNALTQDHSGGILGNLGGLGSLIFDQGTPTPREANAGGILGHIFGNNQGAVAQEVSNKSGLGIGQVAQILMMLAPIVMGYLGQQKQQQNVQADGLGGLLGGLLGGGQQQAAPAGGGIGDLLGGLLGGGQSQAASSGGLGGIASAMLDQDRDGSAMDDIASMAFNYITKK